MEQSTFTVRTLEPREGFYLTQSELAEGAERTFSTIVFLAKDATPSQWREVSQQEKEEYETERAKKLNNDERANTIK